MKFLGSFSIQIWWEKVHLHHKFVLEVWICLVWGIGPVRTKEIFGWHGTRAKISACVNLDPLFIYFFFLLFRNLWPSPAHVKINYIRPGPNWNNFHKICRTFLTNSILQLSSLCFIKCASVGYVKNRKKSDI